MKCQAGPMMAHTMASPTQPYTHRKSEETSASLEPPAMPWAMIQSQPNRPIARSR